MDTKFDAYEVSVELISALRGVVAVIARHDPDLARQLRRAATSVPLNLAEGNQRAGRDRLHLFRVADGSAREVLASLDAAASARTGSTPSASPPEAPTSSSRRCGWPRPGAISVRRPSAPRWPLVIGCSGSSGA